jgi:hypothetical protein
MQPSAVNDSATGGKAVSVTDIRPALSATGSLSGPIRLPRPRPHEARIVHAADTMPSQVPMPRARPIAGGSGAQEEKATNLPALRER